jgi:hypothetical protein
VIGWRGWREVGFPEAVDGFTTLPCVRSAVTLIDERFERLAYQFQVGGLQNVMLFRRFVSFDSFFNGPCYPNTRLAAMRHMLNHIFGNLAFRNGHLAIIGRKAGRGESAFGIL